MSAYAASGIVSASKVWAEELINCAENRETALGFLSFAATTHTCAETISPASQDTFMFSLYFITLLYLFAKEFSFLPIIFF